MKRGLFISTLGMIGMLAFSAHTAHALTTQFDAQAVGNGTPNGTGSYHVVLSTTDNTTFTVVVTGNNDGNSGKHNIGTLQFTFGATLVSTVQVDGGSGSTTTGGGMTGAAYGVSFLPDDNVQFTKANPINDVAAKGGNEFDGTITLDNANARYVTVAFQNASQQYTANGEALTPEAASLALLLPGLVPIGLALRRRRVNRA